MAMVIHVKYFASLREAAGCSEETLQAEDVRQVRDVWRRVCATHAFPPQALCAVNRKHADVNTAVCDGDEVAFFPQITGG